MLTVEGGGGDGAAERGEDLFVLGRRTIHPRQGCWGIPAGAARVVVFPIFLLVSDHFSSHSRFTPLLPADVGECVDTRYMSVGPKQKIEFARWAGLLLAIFASYYCVVGHSRSCPGEAFDNDLACTRPRCVHIVKFPGDRPRPPFPLRRKPPCVFMFMFMFMSRYYCVGFLEIGETGEEGAAREAREEMNAEIDVGGLLAVYGLPHIGQM